MGNHDSPMSLDTQKQIDAYCQEFEQLWKSGETPRLEEFVLKVAASFRGALLRELLAIELGYRTDKLGAQLPDNEFCALHPDLMPDLLDGLQALRGTGLAAPPHRGAERRSTSSLHEDAATVDHVSSPPSSRGLHIRCPHCSNPVELLSDTPHESITCQTCGSSFNLVDPEVKTIEAPTLQRLGRFELISRLGVGGFGTVWKARDTELNRSVAIKIPRKGQLERNEVEQFLREARTVAKLRHANIVPVHEVGREGETLFIVSDYIRGVSLSDWLSGEMPSFRSIAELMVDMCAGLHYAHQEGIIHRDLKPSNILIDEVGHPFLMDFGLAKREVGEITMTVDGQILGTPAYMSPEQAKGQHRWIDRRTDVYSMGVVLFRMLTGELPFRGNSQMQIHQRITKDPPDPRTLNRFIPHDLSTICLKCLESDPNGRFNTAKELADEMSRFLRGEPIRSRPISGVERFLRWTKRKPAFATAAALMMFLAVAGPTAIGAIYYAKLRQAQLLIDRNDVIGQNARDESDSNVKIKALTKQLAVWEGRANPWEFWPPSTSRPTRQKHLADFYAAAKAPLLVQLQRGTARDETTARGYLALAMVADATGREADAIQFYKQARDVLEELVKKYPRSSELPLALAECYGNLARLVLNIDRSAAADHVESASRIYRELAEERKNQAEYQINSLESELIAATLSGFGTAKDHLDRVAQITKSLSSTWPQDPTSAYALACFLTSHQPILESGQLDQLPAK